MIVLDASAAVESLIGEGAAGRRVLQRLRDLHRIHVPELFDLEVMSAIRRAERSDKITEAAAVQALSHVAGLRAERWRHEELLPEAWRRRHRHSTYNAVYVALAKLLDLPLVTVDRRLAASAADDVAVELLVA